MMRRLSLILFLALLASFAFAQQPVSLVLQPLILQSHAAVSTGSVASLANAFSSTNIKGNTIVVVFANGNGILGATPVSDTNSNTYFSAKTQAAGTLANQIWYATNISAGANTVTVTPTGSNASIASEVYEVSGLLALSPQVVDQTGSSSGTGTALTTGNVTATMSNEFAFAAFAVGTAAQTIAVTAPYTNDSGQQNPTTPAGLFSFVSASTYLTAPGTTAGGAAITSEPWAAALASFRTIGVPVQGVMTANQAVASSLNATVVQPTGTNLHAVLDTTSTTAVTQGTATNLKAAVSGNAGGAFDAATGAAPPANAILAGGLGSGATGGFVIAIPVCDSYFPINIVTATTTLAITGVSGRQVHICSINMLTAGANNVGIVEGTGATCATGTTAVVGTTAATGYNFSANGGIALGSGIGTVMRTSTAADSVCIITSAAVQLSGGISYAIY